MKKHLILFAIVAFAICAYAQKIEHVYHFSTPDCSQVDDYIRLSVDGCLSTAKSGNPALPYQSVCLILPEGTETSSIDVQLFDFEEIMLPCEVYPYQPSRTFSSPERISFEKNNDVYSSSAVYPSDCRGMLTTAYRNGVALAVSSFTPVQYEPTSNKIRIAHSAKVTVSVVPSSVDKSAMRRLTPSVLNSLKSMTQNYDELSSYLEREIETPVYDILVITGDSYVNSFDEYVDFNNQRGSLCRVVGLSEIYSSVDGIDNQDKIRNYIINEYTQNGISMVVLGGDVSIVPYRGFYCTVLSGGEYKIDYGIPADLYYAGLDGTWNDNGDDKWAEPGEDDLYPEVGIARMPFNNNEQLQNIINKSLGYQESPVLGEFNKIILGGEFLYNDPYTCGSDYLELLIGYHDDNGYATYGFPEDYTFEKLYEQINGFDGWSFRQLVCGGSGYVNHVGHANTNYVAGWFVSDIDDNNFASLDGTTHNFAIFHSHGCDCGAFDEECCALEKMVVINKFAVCAIGNSRYGWFNEGTTEGPSQHLHREMIDAFSNDKIPFIANALQESKNKTAPWVTAEGQFEEGALRWNFYDLNILGDGAVSLWFDEPITPSANIISATTSALNCVVKAGDGSKIAGATCVLFQGETRIAIAQSDEDGNVSMTFAPLENVDDLRLAVYGLSLYSKSFDIDITGVGELDENQFTVYPNPSDGNFRIMLPEVKCDVRIVNVSGQEVAHFRDAESVLNINMNLSAGVYFVSINGGNAQRVVVR